LPEDVTASTLTRLYRRDLYKLSENALLPA